MGIGVRALTAAAALAVGPGCAGERFWKAGRGDGPIPAGVPTAPLSLTARGERGPVVQAGGFAPAEPNSSWSALSLPGFGKGGKPDPKVQPATMVMLWRNRVEHLPDPTRNGAPVPGLAGQLFLFGARDQFAPAEGRLVVALYDESPRPPGQKPNDPVGWDFTKETLRGLRTPDERFGMSYALFLPWTEYRPDVTRVRIAARFEPENGHTVYPAEEARIVIDTAAPGAGGPGWATHPPAVAHPAGAFSALGGPPPGPGPGLGVVVTGGPPAGVSSQPSGPVAPTVPPARLSPVPADFGAVTPPGPVAPVGPGPQGPKELPPIPLAPDRP